MIASPAFRGKRYAVLGLARSGLATVEALVMSGAEVTAWDNREEARETALALFPGEGRGPDTDSVLDPGLRRGTSGIADPMEIDLAGYDAIVVSPGVPLNTHPIAAKAREAGVPVIGDIELFAQARPSLPPHKVVGITGTNGKSTTTALVHHILKTAGVPAAMGGNIGLPILAQDPLPEGGVYVLELSSYQIDLTFSLDCDVAVLTNITPDHLDRYESFEAYRDSKIRLFRMQSSFGSAVYDFNSPDSPLIEMAHPAGKEEWFNLEDAGRYGDQRQWPALQGPHNLQNAAAAVETCRLLGLTNERIRKGLCTYPGLPHRMERIAEKNGILFVNDSKATNPESTAPALAAYPYIHWIVGGRAKSDGLGPCADQLGHVRAAYTIGESGPMFARLLGGKVPVTECGMLMKAVNDAADAATRGEVVLLSPACASFDQFRDYEARGDAFRAMVRALP
ncbi:MAG TPA: UDP-N-acetylmuramoyl-L-alanine--D-glutamate ligase [Allosphingosinicella sp.]|nr:UDP-N-acetylmuramoyl-L-alanine--D-glutamate ligase [Allosphingosinicella sp.]